ncbi:hypothetical protein [Lederbergia citrea]|nr:hypothetical protein [Lederbergia citrea]
MEIMGFIFGIFAMSLAFGAQAEIKKLKSKVEELEKKINKNE